MTASEAITRLSEMKNEQKMCIVGDTEDDVLILDNIIALEMAIESLRKEAGTNV